MIYIYFFIKSLIYLSRNSVRFENSPGNQLSDEFCEILSHSVRDGMYDINPVF